MKRVAPPLLIALLAGCSLTLEPDDPHPDASPPAPVSDAGFAPAGDAAPALDDSGMPPPDGGMRASPDATPGVCQPRDAVIPDPCPPVCSGGCGTGVCVVLCDQTAACQQEELKCPDGLPCRIECSGVAACQVARMFCPSDAPCELHCSNTVACQQASLHCGSGACSARCSGNLASVALECGPSCGCNPACSP